MARTYNINECAEFLNVSENTALDMAGSGQLPGAKIGKAWVFLEDDLVEYLRGEARRQMSARAAESQIIREQQLAAARFAGTTLPEPKKTRRRRSGPYPALPEVGGQVACA